MDETMLILTMTGGIIVVLGFLAGVVGFLMKLAAEIAVHKNTLQTACSDVESAHDKIRGLVPVVQGHTTDIAVLKNDIGYIREGIDDVRAILKAHV